MANKPSLSEVDAGYQHRGLGEDEALRLINQADRLTTDVYSDMFRTFSEVEGNERDFKIWLARHLWAITEGEATSESQAGGSVTWNRGTAPPGGYMHFLSLTRYGMVCMGYLRDGQSFGVERTDNLGF